MNSALLDIFKNENLTAPIIICKRIGQVAFSLTLIYIVITQFNQGKVGGSPFLDAIAWVAGIGFMVGILCFAIVGLYSLGKNKTNNTAQAVGKSFLKIFLYMYLPAIIIGAVLVFIFVLPRYQ